MTSTTFAEAFLQLWLLYGILTVGQFLVNLIPFGQVEASSVRRTLRSAIEPYSGMAPERLDVLLISSALAAHRDWRRIVLSLSSALSFACNIALPMAYVDVTPQLPHRLWKSLGVGLVLVFASAWFNHHLERWFILSELKRRVGIPEKPSDQSAVE